MEESVTKNVTSWKPKDLTHQTPQSNSLLVAKLQQKVARLEIALKDKEDKLQKIQTSTKVSYINELRIQTEMYYQEVMRIRNELNSMAISKDQHNQSLDDPGNRRPNKANLKQDTRSGSSVERLQKENKSLEYRLNSIEKDKERLQLELESVLKMLNEPTKKSVVSNHGTQTVTSCPNSPFKMEEQQDAICELKNHIEDLQKREKKWEEERDTYRDLVNSLKEDRIFYKDNSLKRQDEFGILQKELLKLQKEMEEFQSNGKPFCKQCSKHSYLQSKTKRLMKDKETNGPSRPPALHRRTHSADGSSIRSSSEFSTKTSETSDRRTSSKNESKAPLRLTKSSSVCNSLSSSSQNSPQGSPKHGTPNSSSRIPIQNSKSSSSLNRKGSVREKPPLPLSPKVIHVQTKYQSAKNRGQAVRESHKLVSPEKGNNHIKENSRVQPKTNSVASPKLNGQVKAGHTDEEIAAELMRYANDDRLPERRTSSIEAADILLAAANSQTSKRSLSSQDETNGSGDSLVELLESHFIRKRKILELKSQLEKTQTPSANKSVSVVSNNSKPSEPKVLSKGSPSLIKSSSKTASKGTSSVRRTSGSSSSSTTPKLAVQNKQQKSSDSSKSTAGKTAQTGVRKQSSGSQSNSEELEAVIALIEGHVARKLFLAQCNDRLQSS